MVYYLINTKNGLYYGKENNINGRILRINTTSDSMLPFIIQEIGYKTKAAAIKAAQKLQKEKGLKNNELQIDGIILK